MSDRVKMARSIIELDEDLKVNPDETADRMEDVRSWAVDLARSFFNTEAEFRIRQEQRLESTREQEPDE